MAARAQKYDRESIGCVKTRLNAQLTPARNARGRITVQSQEGLCDKCPSRPKRAATLGHISQTCDVVHGMRVKRHDKIVEQVAKAMVKSGKFEK